GGGTGIAGGGVVICATGVGCLGGAPAVAVGGVLIAQGAGTTLNAANSAGTILAMLSDKTGSGSDQSRIKAQLEKSINSLQQRLSEHEVKLADYMDNPDAFDNQGFLANAPNEAIREAIIERRIAHLQNEINNFRKQIADLERQLRRME